MTLTFGSVCSGIEAASVAWHPLGWRAAWLAEIEPFPSAVLAHHYPDTPNLGDMTTIAKRVLLGEVPAPDVLTGGTPCQAFSVAGLRASLADARGNLTLKFVELLDAIDHVRQRAGKPAAITIWENVPGVLSTKDNAFGCFLAGLAGENDPLEPPGGRWENAGAVYGPTRAVAWRTLDAQYFGLAQRRRRVFVVASARDGFDPAQVLFEWDIVRRDLAPSRQTAEEAAPCVTAGAGKRFDAGTDDLAVTAHTLRGEGFDASEDGTGRGTPLVPVVGTECFNGDITGQVAATMGTRGSSTNASGPTVMVPVAYATKLHNTQSNQAGKFYENYTTSLDANSPPPAVVFDTTQITSPANVSNPKPGDPCHPLAAGMHPPAIAFPANLSGTQHASTENLAPSMGAANPTAVANVHTMPTMTCGGGGPASHNAPSGQMRDAYMVPTTAMQVRRLTPRECERLQGFPDDYTLIPWRKKPAEECPDGPRYKALGNSWAVPCARWIGRRVAAQISEATGPGRRAAQADQRAA
jgi:DNA (cytosine-5)-methyltransferase 1